MLSTSIPLKKNGPTLYHVTLTLRTTNRTRGGRLTQTGTYRLTWLWGGGVGRWSNQITWQKSWNPFTKYFLLWIQGGQIFWTALCHRNFRPPVLKTLLSWVKYNHCEWRQKEVDHVRRCSFKGLYLPLFHGLRKKGAMTAMPSAPISAACLAFKRRKKTSTDLVTILMCVGAGLLHSNEQFFDTSWVSYDSTQL